MNARSRNQKVLSVETEVVLLDVIDFSLMSTHDQAATAVLINGQLEFMLNITCGQSTLSVSEVVAGFVPTGDGFYVILQPQMVGYGIVMAASLRTSILFAAKRASIPIAGIRVGADYGTLTEFVDVTGKENYVGPVMNRCSRLLGVKTDQAPEGFLKDANIGICSPSAHERFVAAYNYDVADSYFRTPQIGIQFSDWVEIVDKHGIAHSGAFVESSRHSAFNPPKPPDFDERIKAKVEEIRAKYET